MNRDFPAGEWAVPIELARETDFQIGEFTIRPSLCTLRHKNDVHPVEPRVMQALVALAQRGGAVVSRDELIQRCWSGRIVGEDAINRCIAKVRKLADLDNCQSFTVETVPRVGYRLAMAVRAAEAPAFSLKEKKDPFAASDRTIPARPRGWRVSWTIAGAVLLALALPLVTFGPQVLRITKDSRATSARVVAGSVAAGLPAGAVFKDCAAGCPDMVVIPTGYFAMGASPGEVAAGSHFDPAYSNDESPQHEVLIGHRFAMARYDVTREEYARFVAETGRPDGPNCETLARNGIFVETILANWRRPGFQQTLRDPVACVSWIDAEAYAKWLARTTSLPCRLPTEAEWEFAARAGSELQTSPMSPPSAPCRAFNAADADYHAAFPGDHFTDLACHDGYAATSPVGSFPANGFGLYDMLGNVGQWVADCFHRTYDRAPADGSAWTSSNCSQRVVRGGYWALDARSIRIAWRGMGAPDGRFSANGFRVARDM